MHFRIKFMAPACYLVSDRNIVRGYAAMSVSTFVLPCEAAALERNGNLQIADRIVRWVNAYSRVIPEGNSKSPLRVPRSPLPPLSLSRVRETSVRDVKDPSDSSSPSWR